ncbi:MAG: GFA family protein [Desulfopila sp.]|nr:GFA family protein [Desulfopila sp.]
MNTTYSGKGSCLCGATGIEARKISASLGACHCGMCRKWGGGPLLAVDCGTEVTLKGEENISIFESSEWAERAFCKKCGTHLFYRLKENMQYIVPAGLLNLDADKFIFDHQIFIDEKPLYYQFANETMTMTGAEVFAKYGPQEEKDY